MPLPGPEPSETKRRRNKDTHEWVQVENVRFDNAPELPRKRGRWSQMTRRWWTAISTMPHCILWDDADWQFAFDTALIAAAFHAGNVKAATELRQRERIMGTTLDARRDLRIKYVEAAAEPEKPALVAIENYRKKLEGTGKG